ncbi:MAG: serine hydrolase domain-containing protein [Jiangellaceae bacterium]
MRTPAHRTRTAVLLAAMLATLLVSPAIAAQHASPAFSPQPAGDGRPALQATLDQMVNQNLVVWASSVVEDGAGTWAGGAGVRDLLTGTPALRDGYFRMASNTKMMVATTVLSLVADGKIGLDEPVGKYLPGLLPAGDEITVRHLLSHRSGIYDYPQILFDNGSLRGSTYVYWTRFRTYTPQELIDLANQKGQQFEPGSKLSYSNTNYVVLGQLIEKVSGRSWRAMVTERVVKKAGLSTVRFPGTNIILPWPHNRGYLTDLDVTTADVTELNPSFADAAGEAIAARGDVHEFLQALLAGKLIPQAQLGQMLLPGEGLGITTLPLPCGGAIHGHTGAIPGYVSAVFRSQDNTKGMTLVAGMDKLYDQNTVGQMTGLVNEYLIQFFCPSTNSATTHQTPPLTVIR